MKTCKPYFKLTKNSLFPPLGTFSATIPPGATQTLLLPVRVRKRGQVKIAADLNLAFEGGTSTTTPIEPNVLIDILRDGKSIINGPQTLIAIRPIFIEASYSLTTIDTHAPLGKHIYTLVLTNNSQNLFSIDFFNFNAKAITNPKRGKFVVKQSYPPMGTSAIVIPPLQEKIVDLPLIKGRGQDFDKFVKLTISANLIWPVRGVNIQFDILRNKKSIINGPQTMLRALTGGPVDQKQEINFTFDVVDNTCDLGDHSDDRQYQVKFINTLPDLTVEVDYYSFHAEVVRQVGEKSETKSETKHLGKSETKGKNKNCLPFYSNSSYPPLGTVTTTLLPQQTVTFKKKVIVPSGRGTRLRRPQAKVVTNFNFIFPTGGTHKVLFDIARDNISLIGGPQILSLRNLLGAPASVGLEVIRTASVIDSYSTNTTSTIMTPIAPLTPGKHIYSVTLRNEGPEAFDVDYFSFNIEV